MFYPAVELTALSVNKKDRYEPVLFVRVGEGPHVLLCGRTYGLIKRGR